MNAEDVKRCTTYCIPYKPNSYSFIHPSIHPSIHPFIHLFVHLLKHRKIRSRDKV